MKKHYINIQLDSCTDEEFVSTLDSIRETVLGKEETSHALIFGDQNIRKIRIQIMNDASEENDIKNIDFVGIVGSLPS